MLFNIIYLFPDLHGEKEVRAMRQNHDRRGAVRQARPVEGPHPQGGDAGRRDRLRPVQRAVQLEVAPRLAHEGKEASGRWSLGSLFYFLLL